MTSSSSGSGSAAIPTTSTIEAFFKKIEDAEAALLKQPLIAFATALETPGANILTVQEAASNVLLTLPQLSGPAQAAALNIVGQGIVSYVNSLPA